MVFLLNNFTAYSHASCRTCTKRKVRHINLSTVRHTKYRVSSSLFNTSFLANVTAWIFHIFLHTYVTCYLNQTMLTVTSFNLMNFPWPHNKKSTKYWTHKPQKCIHFWNKWQFSFPELCVDIFGKTLFFQIALQKETHKALSSWSAFRLRTT